jgi:hypothetical protein
MGEKKMNIEKIIIISSSMGTVGFGFLAWLQAGVILTGQNEIRCFEDIGYSNIWIADLGILVLTTIASTLCLSILIFQGGRK